MSRPPLPERSLAVVNPELAAQLHPTRNSPVTAHTVSAGSPVRLWWACPRGHEWQTPVKDRIRSAGCPYCAGRLPTPATCLAACNPVLAAQWHPTRNAPLTPADVFPTARTRVWWQCSRGHAWAGPVSSRARGAGCPDCPRIPATTTLLAGYPDLAAQWDTTVNGDLTDAVTSGSNRRVGWRCVQGHRWAAVIYSRTSGSGCLYCAGHRATPQTSVAAVHPQLMTEWAADLNGNLDPATVLGPAERDLPTGDPPAATAGWLSGATAGLRSHLDRALGQRTPGVVAAVVAALSAGGPGDEHYQDARTGGPGMP